jgi:hypothetical protein
VEGPGKFWKKTVLEALRHPQVFKGLTVGNPLSSEQGL